MAWLRGAACSALVVRAGAGSENGSGRCRSPLGFPCGDIRRKRRCRRRCAPSAVEVGRAGLQDQRPAGHGHFRFDHELHDRQPHQRRRIHGAGARDPYRRQRRPAVGGDERHAGLRRRRCCCWLARCAPAPSLDVRDIRLPPRLAMSQRRALGMRAERTGPRPGRSPHPCGALGLPVVANQCRGAGAERHRDTVESGARSGGRRRSSISTPARSGGRHRLQRNRGSGDGEHH